MPIDLNCINSKLLARLRKCSSKSLLIDKRNKIVGKLDETPGGDAGGGAKKHQGVSVLPVFATGFGELWMPKSKAVH